MPSPVFAIRLPRQDRESLNLMAKVYGAPSSGGFVVEMVRVMCSGDVQAVNAFVARLIQRHGEQLTLDLRASVERSGGKPPRKVERRPRKRGRAR